MQKKLVIVVLILGGLLLAWGVLRMFMGRNSDEGELRVDAQITAIVYLDNSVIGKTPYRGKTKNGEYTLKLVPENSGVNASSWQGKIKVGSGLLTYVNATLGEGDLVSAVDVLWLEKITSKEAEIAVITIPDGATIYLNNEAKGVTPTTVSNVKGGNYTLNIASAGFTARTIELRTTGGYRLIVTSKLALGDTSQVVKKKEGTETEIETTPTKSSATGTPKPTVKVALEKPYVIISDTPTGFLRVRTEASSAGEEVARVKPGENYPLVSQESGWYEIKYEGEKTGWISGQYAQKVE